MIKILVVDDEQGVCDVLEKTFSYVGYTTFSATTASKALEIVKKEKPNAIFLDIIMPDMDGLELLKKIKEIDKDNFVVMVTAKRDEDTKNRAFRLGAVDFVTKPFNRQYLRDIISKNLQYTRKETAEKPKILICDDDKECYKNVKIFIDKKFEADVDIATDGNQAIEMIKKEAYDVVLMDVKMPGISGIEALKQIMQINPSTKSLIISAWQSDEVTAETIEAGAIDFLSKPLSPEILKARLKTILASIDKLILKG